MSEAATLTTEPILLREDRDAVTTLTLNRPKQRNSLSEGLMAALQAELDAVADDQNIKVIILSANGPAFSAGHDLKELTAHRQDADRGKAYYQKIMSQCATLMQTIVRHPKPIIARIDGIATAAGCQLVASCDLAVASDTSRFATPGVNIGLFCSTPMVALSRNVSRKQAMEMLLLGEMVDAAHAANIGLINKAVPVGDLDQAVAAMAGTIAAKSGLTVRIGKEAFYRQLEHSLSDAYTYASDVMVQNMLAHDAEEGINAFIEKRHPTWQDK